MNVLTSRGMGGMMGAGRATIIGGDAASLRDFVTYWIGGGALFGGAATVYVGSLPGEAMAFELPLSEGARVMGSVVREAMGVEILLAVPQPMEQVAAFYETALPTAGWQRAEDFPMGGRGFTDRRMVSQRYCNPAAKQVLSVNAGADGEGSAVRLHINPQANPCASPRMGSDVFKYLPVLETPAGARLLLAKSSMSGGGSEGTRYIQSTAAVTTDLSIAAIAQAYADQLIALGWQQASAVVGESVAGSTWIAPGSEGKWSGFLTLMTDPLAQGEYKLALTLYEVAE